MTAHRTARPVLVFCAILAAILTLSACGGSAGADTVRSNKSRTKTSIDKAKGVPRVVRSMDRLGLLMLRLTGRHKNAVASPASAAIAVGMLAEGANGQTASELDRLLGATGAERTDALNAISASLADLDGPLDGIKGGAIPDKTTVHLANNVVMDDQAQILPGYLDALATGFDAGVQRTDLGSAAGKKVLDDWVNKNTGGLIDKSAIEPDQALRLVLQNAVVLAAKWEQPFEPEMTRDTAFVLDAGTTANVKTMWKTDSWRYTESQGWQVVRLPYRGSQLYADILLPPKGSAPEDLDEALLAALTDALGAGTPRRVELSLPKVDTAVKVDLLPLLKEQAPSVVDPNRVDLSGISTAEKLVLSQAWQQAVLRMDEEGTVAAAVTELGADATGAAPVSDTVVMHVDRPYLVRIAAAESAAPLFLARIADPRA